MIPDQSQQHEDEISRQDAAWESAQEARHARYAATPYILERYRSGQWCESSRCYRLDHAVSVADGFTQAVRVRHGGEVLYTNRAADALERSKARAPMMQDKVIHYEPDGDILWAA